MEWWWPPYSALDWLRCITSPGPRTEKTSLVRKSKGSIASPRSARPTNHMPDTHTVLGSTQGHTSTAYRLRDLILPNELICHYDRTCSRTAASRCSWIVSWLIVVAAVASPSPSPTAALPAPSAAGISSNTSHLLQVCSTFRLARPLETLASDVSFRRKHAEYPSLALLWGQGGSANGLHFFSSCSRSSLGSRPTRGYLYMIREPRSGGGLQYRHAHPGNNCYEPDGDHSRTSQRTTIVSDVRSLKLYVVRACWCQQSGEDFVLMASKYCRVNHMVSLTCMHGGAPDQPSLTR